MQNLHRRFSLLLDNGVCLQTAKPQPAEQNKGRPTALQSSQKGIARSSSLLSKQRTAAKAADSDSDHEPAGRSLLRTRAGNASQTGRLKSQLSATQNRPAAQAAASSDSDDDLLHAAHAKQSQSLASKLVSQSSTAFAGKVTSRSLTPALAHSQKEAAGASLSQPIARAASRNSSLSARALPQGLVTQTSLQRSAASAAHNNTAARQTGAAQVQLANRSDADSDEEEWAGVANRAAQPRTHGQVESCKLLFMRLTCQLDREYNQLDWQYQPIASQD